MRLTLIRHAESVANVERRWQGRADYPLTVRGHEQAGRLARAVGERDTGGVDALYASPLSRAARTAAAVSTALTLPVRSWDALQEFDVGVFSGLTQGDIEQRYPELALDFAGSRNWDRVPGAESLQARADRAESVLSRLLSGHADDASVICVTHGGFMQYLLAAVLKTGRVWGLTIHNTAVFEFSIRSAGHASGDPLLDRFSTEPCRIHRFNDTSHLL